VVLARNLNRRRSRAAEEALTEEERTRAQALLAGESGEKRA